MDLTEENEVSTESRPVIRAVARGDDALGKYPVVRDLRFTVHEDAHHVGRRENRSRDQEQDCRESEYQAKPQQQFSGTANAA